MELIFLLSTRAPEECREEIVTSLTEALPGARVDFNGQGTALRVRLTEPRSPEAVGEIVSFRLLGFGIEATPATAGRAGERGAEVPPTVPPVSESVFAPQTEAPRARRTVPLSVFILSLVALAVTLSLIFVFVVPSFLLPDGMLGTGADDDYVGKVDLIDEIFNRYGLYNANGDLLLDEMLRAYVRATGDPYALYYNAEEFAELLSENRGELVGIGVTVVESRDPVGILVIDVIPGSPAEAAGVLPGDLVVSMGEGENAFSVADVGFDLALARFADAAGTVAHFTVLRGSETVAMTATRAVIQAVTVRGRVSETDPKVGIVRITQFIASTPAEFVTVMDSLLEAGCERFVFDVRNNPGGNTLAIRAVLSYLLSEGDLIYSEVYKNGGTESYYAKPFTASGDYAACSVKKEDIGRYQSYPKAVLMNGATASAAELFASALRDHEEAVLVGTKTYGKGVVQQIFSLAPYGYSGALRLTIAHYNPPSGVNYDGVGVTPHGDAVALDPALAGKHLHLLTESEDNQLQAAIVAVLGR